MLTLSRARALRKELTAAGYIPYSAHVASHVVRTSFGDYLQVFRLGGASFESADDEQLNNWHERLNVLWRNIAAPGVALWTHVIRRREHCRLPEVRTGGFADALTLKYYRRLADETLMVNELYLAVLYRPVSTVAAGLLGRLLSKTKAEDPLLELRDALDTCAKLRRTLLASLDRYDPEALGVYRARRAWCSSLLDYLGLLVNGESQCMPLPRGPLSEALATTRLLIGSEVIEYRTPTGTRVGAVLGVKEYATPTVVGLFNRLLSAPFPFVLTQSFVFLSKPASQGLLQRQFYRLGNAGDFAVSQAAELKAALDALTSNEFVMGDHHLSLQVLAEAEGEGTARLRALNDHVALARSILADTGMTVAREDIALEAAFWAQLPGNFAMRPRRAPITSRNFSAMVPFHNYPTGRATGNHWGDALALLSTSAHSPYYFSLHASDPTDPDGGSRKDTGHTFICGPTGSGKTVFIGFMVALLQQRGTTQVIFDKDHGLEILVRALGGEYLPLRNGVATGFNPLQLPPEPGHLEFLKTWLLTLASPPGCPPLSVRQTADLEQALRGVLALPPGVRRLSRLIEFLDATDPEGLFARISPWCADCGGDYAWVFDNDEDRLLRPLADLPVVGFDVTELLDNGRIRSSVTLYLFHWVRQLLDGRRLVCWMDEFWRLVADPAFAAFAQDGPKTWRKLNAVMCLATQSASDVLGSSISRTIIEQTPTKIFFPNAEADAAEYREGFGLTEREFRLVKEQLEPGSRAFLVKQGHHSVVCRLDLQGFDTELAVISGRAGQVERLRRLIATQGADPGKWLPLFASDAGT